MTADADFDALVFIGRFQPFHEGHLHVVRRALDHADRLVVLCGSASQPRSIRNPWTEAERAEMVLGALPGADRGRVQVVPLLDYLYNDGAWIGMVQAAVRDALPQHDAAGNPARCGLIGHKKDQTSYYLRLFPQWRSVEVENHRGISATPIRESILREGYRDDLPVPLAEGPGELAAVLPENVREFLNDFSATEDWADLRSDHGFISRYRAGWEKAPHPPTFVTVDAVVVQSGHILLVERRARPGQGQWALPGGFVDQSETLLDACLRELREETRLKVPLPVLKGSLQGMQVFDEPNRSVRGRTITHAFHFELQASESLPRVKGGDDARRAFWTPLAELDPRRMFEDHYFIIRRMLGT